MNFKIKRYLKVFLFLTLGLVILWLITRNQDMGKIWQEVKGANFWWVILAVFCGFLSHLLRAIRWNQLIKPIGEVPSTSTTFYALMTGYLANLAVPRLGEITRCGTLARHSKIPFNSLAGTVVAERVFDMICLLILIFLTVVLQFVMLKDFLYLYVFSPLLGLLRGNMVLLIIIGITGLTGFIFLVKYFMGVNRNKAGLSGKIKRQLLGFGKGMLSLTQIRGKVLFLLLSLGIWVLYFLTVYLCFFALPGTSHLGVAAGFTVLALGSLGIVAPVPGGIGTYHFITITTLTELLLVSAEPATSYAYIAHAAQMVIILLLGGFSWLALTFRKRETSINQEQSVVPEY